jgi:hypothetical protein
MTKRPLAIALANADLQVAAAALSQDVVFHSPVLATVADEVRGHALVVQILQTAIDCFGLPRNVDEFVSPDGRYIVTFDDTIDGNLLNVAVLFTEDAAGKVDSLRIFMRPWPIVKRFREYMQRHLSPVPIPEAILALPATLRRLAGGCDPSSVSPRWRRPSSRLPPVPRMRSGTAHRPVR